MFTFISSISFSYEARLKEWMRVQDHYVMVLEDVNSQYEKEIINKMSYNHLVDYVFESLAEHRERIFFS